MGGFVSVYGYTKVEEEDKDKDNKVEIDDKEDVKKTDALTYEDDICEDFPIFWWLLILF